MLFWLFCILAGIGIACLVVSKIIDNRTRHDAFWLFQVGIIIIILTAIAILASVAIMCENYFTADSKVAADHERYKSLVYQLENDLYENDNDLGKKALYDEIREWNEDLAFGKSIQRDFWLGIFYPDVFDQFQFIDYAVKG